MYRAYCNDQLFFDTSVDDNALWLPEAKVSLEVGMAGSFTFTIYPSNVCYNNIQKFKSYVQLYRDDKLIFSGRVLDVNEAFYNQKTIVCEGLLAIFNDSIIRPFEFQGTITEFLTMLISSHNSQVDAEKQFTLGTVTVTDPNNYIARSREGYNSTSSILDDTVSTLGGYFVCRSEGGSLFLDYLEDFTAASSQEVNFGENLIDINKSSAGADLITALLPIGAEIETTLDDESVVREKITIASVNGGIDFIQNDEAVAQYGFILGTKEWQDVTRPENLLTKASAYLNDAVMEKTTINITAVDMANAGNDIESFLCGEYIHITSSRHGIDASMLIKQQSINLLSPSENQITVGDTKAGYVVSKITAENNLNTVVEKIDKNYVSNTGVSQIVDKKAAGISDEVIETVNSRIDQSAEEITIEVSRDYATKEELATESTRLTIVENNIAATVESIEGIVTTVKVTENGVEIGKSDSEIKSVQDNDSYQFVDKTNTAILELNTRGVNAPSVNVSKQLKIGDGWAIRQGEYLDGKGYNLNDVWIGG